MRGASLVFHPHICGGPNSTRIVTAWGQPENPYYDKAQVCRSLENTIYFASVNCALAHQESATCLISPAGECLAWAPYGQEVLLVAEVEPSAARVCWPGASARTGTEILGKAVGSCGPRRSIRLRDMKTMYAMWHKIYSGYRINNGLEGWGKF